MLTPVSELNGIVGHPVGVIELVVSIGGKNQDKPVTISFTLQQNSQDSKQPQGPVVRFALASSQWLSIANPFRVSKLAQPAVLQAGQLWSGCPLDTPQGKNITSLWPSHSTAQEPTH